MPKAKADISTFKPLHLLQPDPQKTQGKQIFIFCTDSEQSFWMKENQSTWEKVTINPDDYSCDRDGGSATFKFNGKEFNELNISSPLGKEASYISGDRQYLGLEKLPLSKEKLQETGITSQIELDLSNIPETIAEAEKNQKEKSKGPDKSTRRLTKIFTNNMDDFFGKLSKELSEPGTSSGSGKLTKELSQFKM